MPALRSLLLTAGSILLLITGAPAKAGSPSAGQTTDGSGTQLTDTAKPADRRLELAMHLSQSGALFYGAWWCSHCNHQKELFGSKASAVLPYVECDRDDAGRKRCQKAAVRAYPTWVIGKERREGVLTLDELQAWLNTVAPKGNPAGAAATAPSANPAPRP
jgi:hypothetical protein